MRDYLTWKRGLTSAVAIAAAMTASGAWAQAAQTPPKDDGAELAEIVVTGTSIRGVAAVGSPTVGVNLEELKASGVATASEATRLLPQVLNLGADPARSSFTGGAQDAAANSTAIRSVNLRGIGPEATLLLVNGRRMSPGGVIKAIADMDQIPTAALGRIEVVTDGASAIYGSDAVAGVVNLITQRPKDGAETTIRYGVADNYEQRLFSQTFGKTWEGGGLFVAYEHTDNSHLSGSKRSFTSQDRRARGGTDARPFTAAPGNIVVSGVRYALPNTSGVGVSPAQLVAGTANRFDEAAFADLLPWQDRDSIFGTVRQDINDRLEVWYEGTYTRKKFDLQAPPALFSVSVPATNAFYVRPAGTTAATTVEYRLLDDQNPNSSGFENAILNAAGFSFDLGRDWQVDGYAQASMSRGFQSRANVINNAALTAALASSTAATAFNPYGNGTFNRQNNAALLDIIDAERNTFGTWLNQDYGVKADGPVATLPAGEVRVAVGAEHHDNTFKQSLYATNVLASGATTTKIVLNDRKIEALFGEVFLPVIGEGNAMPGIYRLDLNAAVRWEKYSDFGKTTNPKFSAVYQPISSVTLRGSWGKSFRAPSLVDSADQILNYFIQNLTDPTSPTGTTRGIFYNGGNSGLGPEKAKTWTIGADWRPTGALDGLEVSATYYKIDYTNRIDVTPANALTQGSVYSAFFARRPPASDAAATAAFNARVAAIMASPDLQNPVEAVTNINAIIDGRRQNLGSLKQDGLDLSVAYSFQTDYGRFRAGVESSTIYHVTRQTAAGLPVTDVADTFGNPVDLRVRTALSWSMDGWSANVFANYVDDYTNTAITPNVKAKSMTTVDASFGYRVDDGVKWLEGLQVTVSATNVFDKKPPIVLNGTFSWDSQTASALGRLVSVEVSKRW